MFLRGACPACGGAIGEIAEPRAVCRQCGEEYLCQDGIWRFLPPARLAALAPFLREYTSIRLAEGRGSDDPEFYRRLPKCAPAHPLARQWEFHRRTFEFLARRILPGFGDRLRILDLGAGVGWLSNGLAQLGHLPCAVDLSVDDRDGLGAGRHYEPAWPRVQAEFDHLPFEVGAVDVVIYNASLHYSSDYSKTLKEARRVLRRGGSIVVLETPVYKRRESGQQMVAERHAAFERRYGTRSEALGSLEFLVWGQLSGLGLDWKVFRPWYGWRWRVRPWVAKVTGKREPSQFPILVGQSGSD